MTETNTDAGKLPPKALRKRNETLAALGLRICAAHQGIALPLDAEHFYRSPKGIAGYEGTCKACRNRRLVALRKIRYHNDPAYRAQRLEDARLDKQRHKAKRLPEYARRQYEYKQRQKAKRFARVLEKVTA